MIRKLLPVIIFISLLSTIVSAQKPLDRDKRLRLQTSGVLTLPMGSFSHDQKDNGLPGHAGPTFGAEAMISKPVYHDWVISLFANFNSYSMQENDVHNYLQSRFAADAYYVTCNSSLFQYNITQAGIEFSHNFRLNGIEIEPYMRLVSLGIRGGDASFDIRRKMKNDNYEENINLVYSGGSYNFFYPGAGVHIHKAIGHFLYLTGGLQLMTGRMHTEEQMTTTDVFGGYKLQKTQLYQKVSAFQVSLGIQLRAGRR